MSSRLLSLLAVPLALAGHLLFWAGSATILRSAQLFTGLDAGALALVGAGIVVILAAIATVVFGSLGAYVVGAALMAFSLLVHLLPISGASPATALVFPIRSGSWATGDGMFFYFPPGVGAVVGALFLAAAFASDRRRAGQTTSRRRVLSMVTAAVGLGGLLLALVAGWRVYADLLVILQPPEPLDLVLLYAGAVLAAVPVIASAWSSSGVLIAGAIVVAGAVFELAAPWTLAANQVTPSLRAGIDFAGPSGELLLIGLLLVVAGFAIRARARRADRLSH